MIPVAHAAMSFLSAAGLDTSAASLASSGSARLAGMAGGAISGSSIVDPASGFGGSGPGISGIPGSDVRAPFAQLLTESIGQVEKLEQQAKSSIEGLMSGTGVDVHQAMIASEKAEMGFELVLSVRNKALSAYQQVIGMQF